jgi:ATP-dependent protease ClpP protease subunit
MMTALAVVGWVGRDIGLAEIRRHLRFAGSGPAEFRIRSEGGSGSECLYIAEEIARHPGPTIGRVLSYANSGSILIVGSCRRRIASSGARFGFHPPIATWASTTEAELESFAARYIAFLVEQVGLSWNFVEAMMKQSITLTAKEALQLRLVTEII